MLIKPSSSSESLAPRLPVGQCRSQDEALQGEKLISEGERKPPHRSLPPVTKVPARTSAGCPHHPDTKPKAGRVTPAHPAAGTDRSTGRGMPWAETPVPRNAWLTAAIGILRLGKASGRFAALLLRQRGNHACLLKVLLFQEPWSTTSPFPQGMGEASAGRWE